MEWVDMKIKQPTPGTRIVKRWKNGAVWAGMYFGTDKDSAFDFWYPLPNF